MSRSLERVDVDLTATTWVDLVTVPAGHKFEAVGWSRFLVCTSGTVYLAIQKLDTTTTFLDQLDFAGTHYANQAQFSGYSLYEGEVLQAAFSGTGFVAGRVALAYVDVDYST